MIGFSICCDVVPKLSHYVDGTLTVSCPGYSCVYCISLFKSGYREFPVESRDFSGDKFKWHMARQAFVLEYTENVAENCQNSEMREKIIRSPSKDDDAWYCELDIISKPIPDTADESCLSPSSKTVFPCYYDIFAISRLMHDNVRNHKKLQIF